MDLPFGESYFADEIKWKETALKKAVHPSGSFKMR